VSTSESIEISKAVAAQLTSASAAGLLGGFSFIAQHSMLPRRDFEDMKSLLVETSPRGDVRTFAARKRTQHDYTIQILVRKHIDKEDSLVCEELVLVAEKIADYWERDDSTTLQTRTLTGRDEKLTSPVEIQFSEEKLQTHRLIASTILLTFRGWR
jgi:hypothetical protein